MKSVGERNGDVIAKGSVESCQAVRVPCTYYSPNVLNRGIAILLGWSNALIKALDSDLGLGFLSTRNYRLLSVNDLQWSVQVDLHSILRSPSTKNVKCLAYILRFYVLDLN